MAPAAWDADILPKCMRKATMQRISRAWAQRPRETGLRNVLMWGRASWKIIAGSLRPRVGDSGRLDTSMIAEPAGRSEPSLQLKKSATSKRASEGLRYSERVPGTESGQRTSLASTPSLTTDHWPAPTTISGSIPASEGIDSTIPGSASQPPTTWVGSVLVHLRHPLPGEASARLAFATRV